MARRARRLTPEIRREVIRLASSGQSYVQILEQVDVSVGGITRALKPLGGVFRRDVHTPGPGRLSLDERVDIKVGLLAGHSLRKIASGLGRAPSTVSREVKANGGHDAYVPSDAHRRAGERARRPKVCKLDANPRLCREVTGGLERLWSPQQISRRLKVDFSDDESMQISHEVIYKSLFVQGRGALRKELAACLRTGRTRRHPQGRLETRGRIKDMVNISERPPEIADRSVPGHWEGDLIIGKGNKSAIGTLVERSTRFVILLHLPDGATALSVRDAMTAAVKDLPETLRRSVTWDQGKEMAQHVRFSIDTGIDVYFCDPHSPWQRGSNENTNGLLRQYFPKGTDLSVHDAAALRAVADSLNGRPRQTLEWMKPSEALAQVLR